MIPYTIKSFRGGFSDESDKGIAGSYKFGHALDIHKRDDTLSCKQAMATVLDETRGLGVYGGTIMTGLINVFVPASDGSTYAFSDRGSIWCRTGEGNWTFVYNDENGKINGAAEWEDTNGNNYLYWATATAIARKAFPGVNAAPDTATMRWTDAVQEYKTEFVRLTDWHSMKQAAGSLFITNRESLAEQDFDGNWQPQAMNVRPGNVLACLEERNDSIILGSGKNNDSEEGQLWSWTPVAVNWVQKTKIPVKGINALIATELLLMQGGEDGELFFSDFTNVVPLNSIPGGGKVNPNGVTIENDLAMFGFYGGDYPGIWSFGRRKKNRSHALNYEYRLSGTASGSTISTISAIAVLAGTLIASWGSNEINSDNSYGIDQVSDTTKATAIYEGLEFDGGKPYLEKKFDTIKLTMAPLPVGTSIAAKFKLDKDTSWKYAVLADRTTTFSTSSTTAVLFSINRPAEVYEVGVELNPSENLTPEILSITTYLSNQNNEF